MSRTGTIALICLMLSVPMGGASLPTLDVSRYNRDQTAPGPRSSTRQSICINGRWRFKPLASVPYYTPPTTIPDYGEEWESIVIPTDWKSTTRCNIGDEWYHYWRLYEYPDEWFDCPGAWYARDIPVPEDFTGRHVLLSFDAVNHYTCVFVNGRFAGEHEGGLVPFQIDITDFAQCGETNAISIYVVDESPAEDRAQLAGWGYETRPEPTFPYYSWSGIWQDVNLVALNTVHVDDVFVKTSLRNKSITAVHEIRNNGENPATVVCRASVVNTNGDFVLDLGKKTIEVVPGAVATRTFSNTWENPKLWWPDSPHLYHLKTEIRNKKNKLLDESFQRFGFREVWCENGSFILNGKRVTLWGEALDLGGSTFHRPEAFRAGIREAKALGNRCLRLWGTGFPPPRYFYDIADEEGMMVVPQVGVNGYDHSIIERTKPIIAERVRALRNHPSVVFWSAENERLRGRVSDERNQDMKILDRVIMETDPTRPFCHDDDEGAAENLAEERDKGMVGWDFGGFAPIANKHYPMQNLPLGKQINAPAEWIEFFGDKPIYIGEHLYMGIYVERGAGVERWLGDHTAYIRYDRAPGAYYEILTAITRVWRTYGINMFSYQSGPHEWIHYSRLDNKAFLLDWGTDLDTPYTKPKYCPRINPGYIEGEPFCGRDERFADIQEIYAPMAVSVWRNWKHNYWSEETAKKKIWVTNDTFDDQDNLSVRYRLDARNEWRTIKCPTVEQGSSWCAGTVLLNLPKVKERTVYRLLVELLDGQKVVNRDRMAIHCFPKCNPHWKENSSIGLYDSAGETKAMFNKAGIAFSEYKVGTTDLSTLDLLVIGRNSMDFALEDEVERIDSYIRGGGRMLVFEQPTVNRLRRSIAFVNAPEHPVFKGLDCERFYLWHGGDGEVVDSLSKLPRKHRYRSLVNVGGKGHLGVYNLTSKDIFSALYEEMDGHGLVLRCHLEVTPRFGTDPEATQLVHNMIEYMLSAPAISLPEVSMLKREESDAVLDSILADRMGEEAVFPLSSSPGGILIIGTEFMTANRSVIDRNADAICHFVENGGTVVCLRQKMEAWSAEWLPAPIDLTLHANPVRGAPGNHALTWGMRRALFDFENREGRRPFRSSFAVPDGSAWTTLIASRAPKIVGQRERAEYTIEAGALVAMLSHGQGRYILCQLPQDVKNDVWIREAVLQLLINLGVRKKNELSHGGTLLRADKSIARPATQGDWAGYFCIDLQESANMLFRDESDDDHAGGWTDQGANDMRCLPMGDLLFDGKPFRIIDPSATADVKLHKSCIVLRDGTHKTWLPKERRGIVVNDSAEKLLFVHCCAWSSINDEGAVIGRYEILYEDGSIENIPLCLNRNIADWWNPGDLAEAGVAWIGKNGMQAEVDVGLYLYAWKNPQPDKKIASLSLISDEKAIIILVAVSGKRTP